MSRRKQLKPRLLCTNDTATTLTATTLTGITTPNTITSTNEQQQSMEDDGIDENNNYIANNDDIDEYVDEDNSSTNTSELTSTTLISNEIIQNETNKMEQQQLQQQHQLNRSTSQESATIDDNNYNDYIPKKKRIKHLYQIVEQNDNKIIEKGEEDKKISENENNKNKIINEDNEIITIKEEPIEHTTTTTTTPTPTVKTSRVEEEDDEEIEEEYYDDNDDSVLHSDDNETITSHDTLDTTSSNLIISQQQQQQLFQSSSSSLIIKNDTTNNSNNTQQLFICKICNKGFKHRRSLNRHVKLHTGEKHFKCSYCETAFARSDHLKAHIRTHNNSKPFKCPTCQCGYNTQSALKVHMTHNHSMTSSFTATVNTINTTTTTNNNNNNNNRIKCLNCNKEFDTKLQLDEHYYREHQHQQSTHSYDEISNDSIKIEHEIYSSSKSLICKYCTRVCLGELSLARHLQEEHADKLQLIMTPQQQQQQQQQQQHQVRNYSISPSLRQPSSIYSSSSNKYLYTNQQLLKPTNGFNNYYMPTTYSNNHLHSQSHHPQQQQQQHQQLNSNIKTYCELCNIQFPTIELYYTHNLTTHINTYYNSYQSKQLATQLGPHQLPIPLPSAPVQSLQQTTNSASTLLLSPKNSNTTKNTNTTAATVTTTATTNNTNTNINGTIANNQQELNNDIYRDICIKETQFTCNECNLNYLKQNDYLDHIKQDHCVEVHRCVLCKDLQLFDNITLLKHHFTHVHGSKQSDIYRCKLCNTLYRRFNDFQQHVKQMHSLAIPKSLQIPLPPLLPPPPPPLPSLAQQQQQHLLSFKCPYCSYTFVNQMFLDQHINKSHQFNKKPFKSESFKCSLCDSSFDTIQLLNEHKQKQHTKPLTTTTTTTTTSRQIVLIPGLIQCLFCSAILNDEHDYNEHFKRHNATNVSQVCIVCKQLIHNDNEYNYHLKTHCNNIQKSTKQQQQQQQQAQQIDDSIITCVSCNKQFKRSTINDIELKFNTKTNKLQYQCKTCSTNNDDTLNKDIDTCNNNNNNNNSIILDYLNDYYYCIKLIDFNRIKDDNSLRCLKCNLKFETYNLLINHINDQELHKTSINELIINKLYNCIKCHKVFKNEIEIREHVQLHLNDKTQETCNLCKSIFYTPLQLQCHLIAKHEYTNGVYKCFKCCSLNNNEKIFIKAEDLYAHLIGTHYNEFNNLFKCNKCDMSFIFKQQLMNHLYQHQHLNDIQTIENNLNKNENDQHQSIDEQTQHQQTINNNPFITNRKRVVPLTAANSNQKLTINVPTKDLEAASEFKCVLCDQTFNSQLLLQEHFVNIHTNSESDSEQENNKKETKHNNYQIQHEQQQSTQLNTTFNDTNTNANNCNTSSNSINSDTSKENSLNDNDENHQQQNITATTTKQNSSYTKIDSKNSGFKIVRKYFYSCHRCNLDFNSLKVYQAHLLTHGKSPDSNICCHICGKAFANTRNLNVHLRLHTGFKPFECDLCKRKFTRKENLRSHMKCHLGIRPFLCPICSKSFGRKSHVITHLEVHLKSKIHKCNQCSLQFDSLSSFIKHTISQHKTDANDDTLSPTTANKLLIDNNLKQKSLKELLDSKQQTTEDDGSNNDSSSLSTNDNLINKLNDRDLINICQEYVELD